MSIIEVNYVEKDYKEILSTEALLLNLKNYIHVQKTSLLSSKRNEIINVVSKLITTKEEAKEIIETYENQFGKNIIDELKSLSSSYGTIKEYLRPFINLKIVEKEYPHKMT